MEPKTLLDSDTLSEYHSKHPAVVTRAIRYAQSHRQLNFSLVTRYELLRGLKSKGATSQIANFEHFCSLSEVLPLTDAVVTRAAELYALLKNRGQLLPDADLFIVPTALEYGMVLATNNVKHFSRIPHLQIDNWHA